MKKFSTILVLLTFIIFLSYNLFSKTTYKVLKVYSPSNVAIDINSNGKVDSNEKFIVNSIETLTSKKSDFQKVLADNLNIDEETILAIGYFAEKYAQSQLEDKNVKFKILNNGEIEIFINGKSYNKIFMTSPFAIKGDSPLNKELFNKQIELTKRTQLRIYNNKSNKYHKLSCKYGQMAHDSVILPKSQIPSSASGCKFCTVENNTKKTTKSFTKKADKIAVINQKEKNVIKNIQPQKFLIEQSNIKLFLTDLTTTLKPHNKCTTDYCIELVRQINKTTSSIDMAIYGYTDITDITNALKNAINRGVNVRLVYDVNGSNSNFYPDTFKLAKLISDSKADFGDSSYQNSIMHHKFFIFDKKVVLTGSANISPNDMSGFNSNAIVLINSKEIAQIYEQEFEQMYQEKFHNKKTIILGKQNILLGDSIASVYFSPTDKGIINAVIPLINNAKNYIYIPTFIITHKKMTQALINAKNRGIDIKIILDATNAMNSYSTHESLRKEGILVKTENFAGKMHSKNIIIDDMYVLIGSMNFSKSGENKNDENFIIIENSEIAKYYKNFFMYVWNKIPNVWLTKNVASESHDSLGSCFDGIDNDFDGKIDSEDSGCMNIYK